MQLPQFGHCETENIKFALLMQHFNAHLGTNTVVTRLKQNSEKRRPKEFKGQLFKQLSSHTLTSFVLAVM